MGLVRGMASEPTLVSHLLQQGLGHGAHRHEDSAGCCAVSPRSPNQPTTCTPYRFSMQGHHVMFSCMFLGVQRHYVRRSFSCWCTACSRVCGRGHGSNSCGSNLMVKGCTCTKQTFSTDEEFTVTASSGIRNRDVRVVEIVVRELEKAKPDKWGCVQAREFWSP
jgi:hypothetical protein